MQGCAQGSDEIMHVRSQNRPSNDLNISMCLGPFASVEDYSGLPSFGHDSEVSVDPKNQKLRKRNARAVASTFSRIARSGSIRAISIPPSLVEKMIKKAHALSAVRRPGIKGIIRFCIS